MGVSDVMYRENDIGNAESKQSSLSKIPHKEQQILQNQSVAI